MIAVDTKILTDKLNDQTEGTAIFIALDSTQTPLGFIHLQARSDYYNHKKHGHISNIIVAPAGEGKGIIGALLMKKAQEWAQGSRDFNGTKPPGQGSI
jgi:hypothetical protein